MTLRYKVDHAYNRLMRQKSWKHDLKVESITAEYLKPFIDAGGITVVGNDHEGRSVVYVRAALIFPDTMEESYDFIKYFYY